MSYLFIEKTQISNKVKQKISAPRVLVAEPETDFLNLISYVLSKENFEVRSSSVFEEIFEVFKEHQPKVVILGTKFLMHPEFAKLRMDPGFSNIILISIGDSIENEELKRAMNNGFSGHLDRKFSRPQDLVQLINCLLTIN